MKFINTSRIAAIRSHVKPARLLRNMLPLASACLAILFSPESASAAFHIWSVTEVYSSADGTVQFIELSTAAGSQQFVAGQSISSVSSSGTHTFTFPSSLPSDSANKTCIIGTSNLVSIPGGLVPDFFIANNFIGPAIAGGNATVTYNASGSSIAYTNLPIDGDLSLTRSGGSVILATNSPKNFKNQSNSIVPLKFKSFGQSGDDFILSFATATGTNGTAGPNYAVEFQDTINGVGWQTLVTGIGGNGTVKAVTNSSPPDPQRFYRLRVP
jgi:hypothetical protein